MRVLLKECRKILDIKVLIFLAIFTALFYQMFMEIRYYPAGGQCTDSPYDIPFEIELVKEWGTTLSKKELNKIDDKQVELEKKFAELIADNKILSKNKITTYKKYMEAYNKMCDDELENDELEETMTEVTWSNEATSKITFELQVLRKLRDTIDANEMRAEQKGTDCEFIGSKKAMEIQKDYITRDYISLVPGGVFYILQKDMKYLAILILICFFALMIPYQICDRLRNVMPIYATTQIGRRIFVKQFGAAMVSCGTVGIVQCLLYVVLFMKKGLSVFWICECWDQSVIHLIWCREISFGAYMFVYLFLVLFFALISVGLIYILLRIVPNYVAGVIVSIPACLLIGFGAMKIFSCLFEIGIVDAVPYWELICIVVWMVIVCGMLKIRFGRDKRMDML